MGVPSWRRWLYARKMAHIISVLSINRVFIDGNALLYEIRNAFLAYADYDFENKVNPNSIIYQLLNESSDNQLFIIIKDIPTKNI